MAMPHVLYTTDVAIRVKHYGVVIPLLQSVIKRLQITMHSVYIASKIQDAFNLVAIIILQCMQTVEKCYIILVEFVYIIPYVIRQITRLCILIIYYILFHVLCLKSM